MQKLLASDNIIENPTFAQNGVDQIKVWPLPATIWLIAPVFIRQG